MMDATRAFSHSGAAPNTAWRSFSILALFCAAVMWSPQASARQSSAGDVAIGATVGVARATSSAHAQPLSEPGKNYIRIAAGGKGGEAAKPKAAPEEPPIPQSTSLENLSPGDQYCAKIGEIAASSQFAQQRKALAKAQEELEARIKALAEKTEEFKVWSKKYDDFTKKATDNVLQIYLKMKPEVAAKQILAMSPSTAASIVAKLPAKTSSAILAEMEPARAARLSSVLAGAVKADDTAASAPLPATAPAQPADAPASRAPQTPPVTKDKN